MCDRRGLRETVALDELRAGELDEPPMSLDEERCRAGDACLDRAQVVLRRERRVVDHVVDDRCATEQPRAMALNVLQEVLEVELGLEDHGRRGLDREAHHHSEPVNVEERHDRHRGAFAVAEVREPGPALERVRDERAMREHRALRDPGRAAGVLEQREVVWLRARIERLGRPGE